MNVSKPNISDPHPGKSANRPLPHPTPLDTQGVSIMNMTIGLQSELI